MFLFRQSPGGGRVEVAEEAVRAQVPRDRGSSLESPLTRDYRPQIGIIIYNKGLPPPPSIGKGSRFALCLFFCREGHND